eukprot:gene38227-50143_t
MRVTATGHRPRALSLRRTLLLGILLPVFAFLLINTVVLYRQALVAADTAYDRTLLATAKSLGEQLRVTGAGNELRVESTVLYSALEAFEADNRSRIFYRVSGLQGELVSGFDDMPAWRRDIPQKNLYAALVNFYDDEYQGVPVRMAVLLQPVSGVYERGMATIPVAETLELRETLAQVDDLLVFCQRHLQHENDFVHTAIEARQPGGAARTADDHVDHVASIQALRAEAAALPCHAAASRPALAQRLYLHLSLFVAENFQHMQVEETANNAALWALYTDDELVQIHDRLVASLPPAENAIVARWMVPALNPAERAGLFCGMQLGAPPEAFEAVLGIARLQLDETAWR